METALDSYKVKAGTFEGPLDLLLSLIESRKLFVNEISLAEVTNDYIAYTKNLGTMPMWDITNFIVVAATLILIKSRSLLPNMELTMDEKEKIVDLESRLKLYQVIKDIGIEIGRKYGKVVLFHSPERSIDEKPIFVPSTTLTLTSLRMAALETLDRIPKEVKTPEVSIRKVMSIEEMIGGLTERIQSGLKLSFKEFSNAKDATEYKEKKVYVIVSFLAMLELVRQGIVDVLQDAQFADMEITKSQPAIELLQN